MSAWDWIPLFAIGLAVLVIVVAGREGRARHERERESPPLADRDWWVKVVSYEAAFGLLCAVFAVLSKDVGSSLKIFPFVGSGYFIGEWSRRDRRRARPVNYATIAFASVSIPAVLLVSFPWPILLGVVAAAGVYVTATRAAGARFDADHGHR